MREYREYLQAGLVMAVVVLLTVAVVVGCVVAVSPK